MYTLNATGGELGQQCWTDVLFPHRAVSSVHQTGEGCLLRVDEGCVVRLCPIHRAKQKGLCPSDGKKERCLLRVDEGCVVRLCPSSETKRAVSIRRKKRKMSPSCGRGLCSDPALSIKRKKDVSSPSCRNRRKMFPSCGRGLCSDQALSIERKRVVSIKRKKDVYSPSCGRGLCGQTLSTQRKRAVSFAWKMDVSFACCLASCVQGCALRVKRAAVICGHSVSMERDGTAVAGWCLISVQDFPI